MKPSILQQIILYRYRYIVGYTALALFSIFMIFWQLGSLGPGISEAEKISALASGNWTWNWREWQDAAFYVVNLPYVFLQKLSIWVFGVTPLGIRLPSALIALITSLMFFLLMRCTQKTHVTIGATLLFTASSWYISFTHFGTPLIMTPFVWILLIYGLIKMTRLDSPMLGWAALTTFAGVLALYTPYGLYALLIAFTVAFIHPQTRRSIAAITGPQIVLGIFIATPFLVPLIWGLYQDVSQAWLLLGLTNNVPSPQEFGQNIWTTIRSLTWYSTELPALRAGTLPLLDFGTLALFIGGLYRLVVDWRSIRSQFLALALLVLFIVTGLAPAENNYVTLMVPIYLVAGIGVTVLFSQWYRLFPRNPYARSFGLIPIVLFFILITSFHYQKYFVAWANAPATHSAYSRDIPLMREQLEQRENLTVVVPERDLEWYQLATRDFPTTKLATSVPTTNQPLLIEQSFGRVRVDNNRQATPIVNEASRDALRFWLVVPR